MTVVDFIAKKVIVSQVEIATDYTGAFVLNLCSNDVILNFEVKEIC